MKVTGQTDHPTRSIRLLSPLVLIVFVDCRVYRDIEEERPDRRRAMQCDAQNIWKGSERGRVR